MSVRNARTGLSNETEHAVVQDQVDARPRHQHGKPSEELHRIEHDVLRPVGPRLSERQAHLTLGGQGEPLGHHGRPQRVTADPLEPLALPRRDDEPRMQVEAIPPGMTKAQWRRLTRLTRAPKIAKARARMMAERHEPLHQRRRQARERRCLVRPRIGTAVLGGAPVVTLGEPAPIEQPSDPGAPRLPGTSATSSVLRRRAA